MDMRCFVHLQQQVRFFKVTQVIIISILLIPIAAQNVINHLLSATFIVSIVYYFLKSDVSESTFD